MHPPTPALWRPSTPPRPFKSSSSYQQHALLDPCTLVKTLCKLLFFIYFFFFLGGGGGAGHGDGGNPDGSRSDDDAEAHQGANLTPEEEVISIPVLSTLP